MSVGTSADRITTVTRIVYVAWSMKPCVYPKRDAIVPNVRPVDMSRVV